MAQEGFPGRNFDSTALPDWLTEVTDWNNRESGLTSVGDAGDYEQPSSEALPE